MNETRVVLCGNVASDVRMLRTEADVTMAKFRLAVTKRRRDASTGEYEDLHTSFYSVTAFRSLAENVLASVGKGDPVVVTGELRVGEYVTKDGESRLSVDIDASAVGHDLARGRSRFSRTSRPRASQEETADGTPAAATSERPRASTAA